MENRGFPLSSFVPIEIIRAFCCQTTMWRESVEFNSNKTLSSPRKKRWGRVVIGSDDDDSKGKMALRVRWSYGSDGLTGQMVLRVGWSHGSDGPTGRVGSWIWLYLFIHTSTHMQHIWLKICIESIEKKRQMFQMNGSGRTEHWCRTVFVRGVRILGEIILNMWVGRIRFVYPIETGASQLRIGDISPICCVNCEISIICNTNFKKFFVQCPYFQYRGAAIDVGSGPSGQPCIRWVRSKTTDPWTTLGEDGRFRAKENTRNKNPFKFESDRYCWTSDLLPLIQFG